MTMVMLLLLSVGLFVSGCAGTWVPRCSPPIENDQKPVADVTNTPCAAKLTTMDGKTSTYVIIHSTKGYLGEEKP